MDHSNFLNELATLAILLLAGIMVGFGLVALLR